jgi:hypothetical protein
MRLLCITSLLLLVQVSHAQICGTHIKFHNPATLCADGVNCKVADFCETDPNQAHFCHIDEQPSSCLCQDGSDVFIERSNQGTGGTCATLGCSIDELMRNKEVKDLRESLEVPRTQAGGRGAGL